MVTLSGGGNRRLCVAIVGQTYPDDVQFFLLQQFLALIVDAHVRAGRLVPLHAGGVVVGEALGEGGQFHVGEASDRFQQDARMTVGADESDPDFAGLAGRLRTVGRVVPLGPR